MPKLAIATLLLAAGLVFAAGPPAVADDEGAATPQQRQLWTKKWGRLGPVYDLAIRFTWNHRHEDAVTLLLALKRADNPRVLNYLGYNTRKMGRPAEAVFYYEKAIAIAPEFTLAREYLGEAYLMLNQPAKAKEQLAAIEKLCGTTCGPYKDLAADIAGYKAGS